MIPPTPATRPKANENRAVPIFKPKWITPSDDKKKQIVPFKDVNKQIVQLFDQKKIA